MEFTPDARRIAAVCAVSPERLEREPPRPRHDAAWINRGSILPRHILLPIICPRSPRPVRGEREQSSKPRSLSESLAPNYDFAILRRENAANGRARTSRRLRKPSEWMAVWCTKISSDPSSGVMKPKPFWVLNHFTCNHRTHRRFVSFSSCFFPKKQELPRRTNNEMGLSARRKARAWGLPDGRRVHPPMAHLSGNLRHYCRWGGCRDVAAEGCGVAPEGTRQVRISLFP